MGKIKRERVEWCEFYWFDTNINDLPRILLIGDSIVANHRAEVATLMEDKAVISAFSTSKIVGDPAIYRELALAMADYPVDMIYFNNGLHGLEYDDTFYRNGLREFVDFLRISTRARLFWRSSTPVRVAGDLEKLHPLTNQIVLRRNEIAEEIMNSSGIPCDDFYRTMVNHPEFFAKDGCHYNTAGIEAQAKHIAKYLEQALRNNNQESS